MEFGGWGICTLFKAPPWIACIAGRISVGMLYCFGGRAEGRVAGYSSQFEVPSATILGYFEYSKALCKRTWVYAKIFILSPLHIRTY